MEHEKSFITSRPGHEVIKLFFLLNLAEHENFSANKYEKANYCQLLLAFSYSLAEKFSCSAVFSKKELAFFSNLRFISKTKSMLS